MPDREKVIKGLEICVDREPGKYTCNECPYEIDGNYCEINLAKDAIALLQEQEAVEPGLMQDAKGIWNTCGKCGHILKSAFFNPMDKNDTFFYYSKFCPECGQAVKWT